MLIAYQYPQSFFHLAINKRRDMNREKSSILLVDGSATHLFYMGMMLIRLEYIVFNTTTAENALRMISDLHPSLVLTDTALPSMSGVDLLKQMKREARLADIPVIIHTSDHDPTLKETCFAAGCEDFFIKPADPDVLYPAIQAATQSVPRKNIRIETRLKVEFGDWAIPDRPVRTEYATTLSEKGLYIKTLTPEPENTILDLKIFIQNREIKAKAKVLYSSIDKGGQLKELGMGILFVNISLEDKAFVHTFIREQITSHLSLLKF
jgi:CheY-like chemotaxis protein